MSQQKRLNGIVRNTNLKKGKKKRTGGQKEDNSKMENLKPTVTIILKKKLN